MQNVIQYEGQFIGSILFEDTDGKFCICFFFFCIAGKALLSYLYAFGIVSLFMEIKAQLKEQTIFPLTDLKAGTQSIIAQYDSDWFVRQS